MYKKIIFLVLFCIPFLYCNNSTNTDVSSEIDDGKIDSLLTEETLEVSEKAMEEIIENISSPIEMAALIEAVGVPFSMDYLCSTDNVDDYNTNFRKALGLGFLGADLGYLNIYSKTSQIVIYITAIKKLADGLKVGQFFDFNTLKRLASNNENLDSLMYISVNSFNRMDKYLRDNRRGDHSSLIIAGVWIEGMYLATQVVKEKSNKDIAERIGEQKIILDQLMLILKNYKSDKNFQALISDFEEIKTAYRGVEITYEIGEPEAKEIDGKLVIVQNEKSIVYINDEQLNSLTEVVARIRNKHSFSEL